MTAVKAISPTDAWAVGADSFNESRGAQLRAVIEHWDGKRWRVAARPLGPSPFSSLTSVDAAGRSDVWAVGSDPQRPLALHFNGTAWARATLPTASGFDAYLADVSVASAADVWAVGTETSTGFGEEQVRPLVLHFDGQHWTRVALPPLPPQAGLSAVSARPGEVFIAGTSFDGSPGSSHPIVLHRSHIGWAVLPLPAGGDQTGRFELTDVAAVGPGQAWMVGTESLPNNVRSLAWHWRAGAWRTLSPDPRLGSTLTSVTAAGPTGVWAGGTVRTDPQGHDELLLTVWNGSRWEVAFSVPALPGYAGGLSLSWSAGHVFAVVGDIRGIAVQN